MCVCVCLWGPCTCEYHVLRITVKKSLDGHVDSKSSLFWHIITWLINSSDSNHLYQSSLLCLLFYLCVYFYEYLLAVLLFLTQLHASLLFIFSLTHTCLTILYLRLPIWVICFSIYFRLCLSYSSVLCFFFGFFPSFFKHVNLQSHKVFIQITHLVLCTNRWLDA